MHGSAKRNCHRFFEAYLKKSGQVLSANFLVGEIGARDVNGSLRECCPLGVSYLGFDIQAGDNVDHVMPDAYKIPLSDASLDVVLSTSCFEHAPMFWLLFIEMLRVLKPGGLLYLCAPANGDFHRFPVDCWRFYPDSGAALMEWGCRCGFAPVLLESYTGHQDGDIWNDFVAVFVKEGRYASQYPYRILDDFADYDNGYVLGAQKFSHYQRQAEDQRRLKTLTDSLKA